ncbi:MAG: ATP-binding protein, partial [candidate division KSB1 bacterium]
KNSNVVSTQDGKYYIRVGSTKRQPSKDELARLFQRSRQIQFDETVIEAASLSDIDLARVDAFLQGLKQPALGESKLPLENLLLNLRILKADERGVFPTVAGVLAFGKNGQSLLPGAEIQAAYYRGDSRTSEVLDQKAIRGAVTEQIEAAVSFVKNNMRVGSVIQGVKRIEFPEYSWEAAREAITNAVAHRNYSLAGSGIRLFMYADRLEVLSPGRLPNTLTLESIKVVQFARNQLLASYLAGMGYMEKRGEGILRMIDWSRKNQAPEPKFELPAEELFQVTLFKRVSSSPESHS